MLTPREQEVLRLLEQGKQNKEIAAQLGITKGVVEQHNHAIYQKLGASNRTEAVYQARQKGLIQ